MKLFKAHDSRAARELLKQDRLKPSEVSFSFRDVQDQIGLEYPETILIQWNGELFMCPRAVVANALEREKALAKHSEHYRMGDMFTPTMILLSQCLHLNGAQVEVLVNKPFHNH